MNTTWINVGMKVKVIGSPDIEPSILPTEGGWAALYHIGDFGRIADISSLDNGFILIDFNGFDDQPVFDGGRWFVSVSELIPQYESMQQMFELMATHLLTQADKSESAGICLYRKHDEDDAERVCGMCAIGAIIPDNLYDDHFEMQSVSKGYIRSVFDMLLEFDAFGTDKYTSLPVSMQSLHDTVMPEDWPEKLEALAKRYELNTDFLKTVKSPLLPTSTEV